MLSNREYRRRFSWGNGVCRLVGRSCWASTFVMSWYGSKSLNNVMFEAISRVRTYTKMHERRHIEPIHFALTNHLISFKQQLFIRLRTPTTSPKSNLSNNSIKPTKTRCTISNTSSSQPPSSFPPPSPPQSQTAPQHPSHTCPLTPKAA